MHIMVQKKSDYHETIGNLATSFLRLLEHLQQSLEAMVAIDQLVTLILAALANHGDGLSQQVALCEHALLQLAQGRRLDGADDVVC